MNYRGRHLALGMFGLSSLLVFAGIGLFYFSKVTKTAPDEVLILWFIASIILTELTLFDALHNQRLRKKVLFALLLHFIPILSVTAYWWWRIRETGQK